MFGLMSKSEASMQEQFLTVEVRHDALCEEFASAEHDAQWYEMRCESLPQAQEEDPLALSRKQLRLTRKLNSCIEIINGVDSEDAKLVDAGPKDLS